MRPAVRRIALSSATIVLAVAASAAQGWAATPLPEPACPQVAISQPFAHFGDLADYFLAPGGDFESRAAGWTLAGGAAVVQGNSPLLTSPAPGRMSLDLPAGASATAPPICIGVEHRSLRFVARGPGKAKLEVEASYLKPDGKRTRAGLADVAGTGEWAPTRIIDMRVNKDAAAYGNALWVTLRFAPKDGARWRMDDLHIDPFRGR